MRTLLVVVLLALPAAALAAFAPAVPANPASVREGAGVDEPVSPGADVAATSVWAADEDGIDAPLDRCPDRGKRGGVDDFGCPITALDPWLDEDRDGLMNGRSIAVRADHELVETLAGRGIVHGVLRDGRWVFFGEASFDTDPRHPNTDRYDRLGDGFEVALMYGLTTAAGLRGYGARVVQPEGVPLADPLVPDDYLELHPAIVGTTVYWNEALEAALRQVVEDDLHPEANDTYAPPSVRLHVFVEDEIALPDATLTFEDLHAAADTSQIRQHLEPARRKFASYVVVAETVEWSGDHVAGLAIDNVLLIPVGHKGFHECEAEGGRPGTPACDRLMELFRWTLNHERLHPYGLADTYGKDELMSTAPGVYTARPWESQARFDFVEAHPEDWQMRWRRPPGGWGWS